MRGFNGTKASLHSPHLPVCASICGHGTGFVIHLLLAAVALATGHPWGAFLILMPGAVSHLYPVLLQRSILLRLQPELDKSRG